MSNENVSAEKSALDSDALEELRRRERELADFIENAPVGLHWVGADGAILWANQAELELLGYTREEYIGRHIAEFHADESVISDILARLTKNETLQGYEARLRCKDGSIRHVLISSNVWREGGEFIHTRCFTRDITDRKRAEEALRSNEEQFRAVAETALDAIITIDEEDTILFVNQATQKIFGYDLDELRGQRLTMLMPEYLRHIHQSGIQRYVKTGEKHIQWKAVELPGLHKNGHEVPLEISFSEYVKDGKRNFTGIAREITERRRIAEALYERTRQAELSALLSLILTRSDSLTDMLSRCAEVTVEHLDAAFARIWTLNSDENVLELQASAGMYTHLDGAHGRVPVGKFKIGKIAHERQPHLTNDVIGDPQVGDQEWAKREGMVAFAGYPLIVEDKLIGVVAMFARKQLTEATLQAMASVANAVSLGVERKRVEEERTRLLASARASQEETETINQLGRLLSAELDLQKLVQAVTDTATHLTNAHFGSFFYNLIDERGASYTLYTLSGVPREAFAHFPMPRATDIFSPTFRGEGVVRLDDVRKDPRFGKNSPYYGMPEGHLPVVSYLAVPVISRSGEVLGGLFFGHPDAGVFTEPHERIVVGLAAQTAIAMDNARLYEAAKHERAKAEQSAIENERLYRQAQEANRLKDEFLATVSHELRTPLTAILGWSHLLRGRQLDEKNAVSALETIERNARAQAQLIDDLLDVSRIITGKLRLDIRAVDPASFIESAIESLRPAAEAKGVRIQKVMDTGVVSVAADPGRLQQMVWNLLSNAIKFTPKGGRVQVRLERVNSHIEIAVSDTGAGIKSEFLPFVFERFRQADQQTTRKHGGLGLGLAIVRHLVELHGGTVEAESQGEDQGATFVVKLPIVPVYQKKNPDERVHPADRNTLLSFDCPERLDRLKVLVVDDEADTRELLRVGISQCGAEVVTAGSSQEALEAIEKEQPSLIVSDIGMPGEDGYELIRKVRELPAARGGKIPAIALTAYARTEDRLRAIRAGYQMHIPKPVELAELVVVMASLIQRSNKAE